MGLFGGGTLPEGKGVSQNAPKKKGIFLFFDIIGRKWSKFIGMNLLYILVSLPMIALLYFFAPVGTLTEVAKSASNGDQSTFELLMLAFRLFFSVTITTLWGSGPASAAFAYIARCYTREEHAWIISDGFDKLKENFKQGIMITLIDAVMYLLAINAILFYVTLYQSTGSLVWMVGTYVCLLMLGLYTILHFYVYQIMITFECSIGAIYKNAMLMTLAKFPQNVLLLAYIIVLSGALFLLVHPAFSIVLISLVGWVLMRYPVEFYVSRVIDKNIIKPGKRKKAMAKVNYIEEES